MEKAWPCGGLNLGPAGCLEEGAGVRGGRGGEQRQSTKAFKATLGAQGFQKAPNMLFSAKILSHNV